MRTQSKTTMVFFRFTKYFKDPDLRMAAYLVPRFKLDWVSEEEKIDARNELQNVLLKECAKQGQKPLPGTAAALEKPQGKVDSFFHRFNKTNSNTSTIRNEANLYAEGELIRYLHDCGDIANLSPIVKDLFVKYNTAVPSSAHCERLFSAAGHLFTDKRSRMSDKNFEMQLLLKINIQTSSGQLRYVHCSYVYVSLYYVCMYLLYLVYFVPLYCTICIIILNK